MHPLSAVAFVAIVTALAVAFVFFYLYSADIPPEDWRDAGD